MIRLSPDKLDLIDSDILKIDVGLLANLATLQKVIKSTRLTSGVIGAKRASCYKGH